MELRDDLIVLRPWREDDADAVYAACQDAEIQHWIPVIPRPYTHDDAHAFVTGELELGRYQFAIAQEGQVVGLNRNAHRRDQEDWPHRLLVRE